jgi:hypothetical protein
MNKDALEAYSVRSSGAIGQEIVGLDGTVIAWTIDPVLAVLIAQLLTMNDQIVPSARHHSTE